jgi:peptidoglycan/xylan/chitin deacetylase (PgdA/CDA1 family)
MMRTWMVLLAVLCVFVLGVDVAYAPTSATAAKSSFVSGKSELKDPTWIADPVNYEQTNTMTVNTHVSVPILEYHEAKYTPGNVITLRPGQFLSEVKWLHSHGFHTINFGQLYAAMYFGYKLPSRPVLLTFDDGYESVYLDVFPILKRYGYQATVFAISGDVHDKPNRSVKYPKLTTEELKIMQRSGIFDIESHTVHHVDLSTVSSTVADEELRQSAESLARIVGHPIKFFCYPYGHYKPQTIALVKKNGYLLATTQHTGYANLSQGGLTLDRICIYSYDTLTTFAEKLAPSLNQ